MVPLQLGDFGVSGMVGSGKLALVGMALIALALGGCGRKSGLDLPPQAAAQPAAAGDTVQAPRSSNPLSVFDTEDDDRPAAAPQGQKRRIFLDNILD
ncbi:hypothetical protein X566_05230 [Afipia sp. P52-10]|jgi:predicted small lipoprotein YifL|uniref:lipoprotein n=1 Tax=Afipia sp. P52-10 TaxID=1429916 RepID=UPI0003DF2930|nr:lipoprotein [Afipia sp. P52-10]ETR77090.1 hypothetical protein X566_05230 [Afipia sp. P52-10]